ncbi:glycosyltransferase family 2 protein [Oceanidesulfovibrio marinus]|uniref:Glycosyltransferase family 2 protein n=1 Tax=Oceanidesulfovibrio marinus TaxID=370038 RepID=A0A6P1ZJT0_9BACT|nr:glycosyltransferase family 2 protein [Oceanidesulfovibrio marinus]TVM35251.1 glycosyltransferase family 2 protein [Oceanidesulfovibrio marinus]
MDISIVMPAHNEAESITAVLERIQRTMDAIGRSYEIVLVDDGSTDETAALAEQSGARVVSNPMNMGNGAAVKAGLRNAQGEIIVLLDADGQHPPERIPDLLAALERADMVVGARSKDSDTKWHRDLANTVYNRFASYITGVDIKDLTSGFRALRAEVGREFIYLLPNTFSYPTTLTMAVLRSGLRLIYVPIQGAKRRGKSKIKLMKDGPRFLLIIMRIATLFSPMKIFFPVSLGMFAAGLGWGLFKILFLNARYGPTSAMLMTVAVLTFLVGLVSEQVTTLLYASSARAAEAAQAEIEKEVREKAAEGCRE